MLLRNIFDFSSSLVIHHYPHRSPQIKRKRINEKKMNTKRINYLVKMISSLGHKIMFSLFVLPQLDFYLAQGQGLTFACVSFHSVRISFILINHYVISYGLLLLLSLWTWFSLVVLEFLVRLSSAVGKTKTFYRSPFSFSVHFHDSFTRLPKPIILAVP